jgi:hypothetical protein
LVEPLTSLVVAAIGDVAALRATFDEVPGVQAAFLAGDLAQAGAHGAMPLVVIGNVPLEELDALESRPAAVLSLPAGALEVAYYRPDDWRTKLQQGNPYLVSILKGKRLELIANHGLVPSIPA